jgi:hypothetical protein
MFAFNLRAESQSSDVLNEITTEDSDQTVKAIVPSEVLFFFISQTIRWFAWTD